MAISKEEQRARVEEALRSITEAKKELKEHRRPCDERDDSFGIHVISSEPNLEKGMKVTNNENAKLLKDNEQSIKAFQGGYQEVNAKDQNEGIDIGE